MKTLIMLSFLVWRHRHGGMRRIVDSRRHHLRRRVVFHCAMVMRRLAIVAGY